MKRAYRWIALALVLCLSLPLLPVYAAETCPQTIEAVTSKMGDITVTTANVWPLDNGQIFLKVDLSGTGLSYADEMYLQVTDGLWEDRCGISLEEGGSVWLNITELGTGAKTLDLSLMRYDYEAQSNVVYAEGSVSFYLAADEEFPAPTAQDLAAWSDNAFDQESMSGYVSVYMPVDTQLDAQTATMHILDQAGNVVGGPGEAVGVEMHESSVRDVRYEAVLGAVSGPYVRALQLSMYQSFYQGLPAGKYNVQICDGSETTILAQNAVEIVDCPVLEMGGSRRISTQLIQLDVQMKNGKAEDLQVKALDSNGTCIGTSDACRIIGRWSSSGERVTYQIPLSRAVGQYESIRLTVSRKDGGRLEGNTEEWLSSAGRTAEILEYASAFVGVGYSNLILAAIGTSQNQCYRIDLKQSQYGPALYSAQAYPNEDGVFDVHFTDETGAPILLPREYYYIVLSSASGAQQDYMTLNGGSRLYGMQLMQAQEPVVFEGYASIYRQTNGTVMVTLEEGDLTAFSQDKEKWSVQLCHQGTGNVTVLKPYDMRVRNERLMVYFDSSEVYGGEYIAQPYFDGRPLAFAGYGEEQLLGEYVRIDQRIGADVYMNTPGPAWMRMQTNVVPFVRDGDVRLQLYRPGNISMTPDGVMDLSEENNYGLTQTPVGTYKGVYTMHGKLAGMTNETGYWCAAEDIDYTAENYAVSASAEMENGRLNFYSVHGLNDGKAEAFSEIFVEPVPEEGCYYVANSITVNGQPIAGRNFAITQDSVISAEFKEIPGYEIASENYRPDAGSVTFDRETARAGETVTVTAAPNEGYYATVVMINHKSSYGTRVPFTQTAPNTWTFTMPEDAVVVTVSFNERRERQVYAYTEGSGTIGLPEDAVMIDEPFSFTAQPEEGNHLVSLYYNINYGTDIYLVEEPTLEAGEYTITDNGDPVRIYAEFAEKQAYAVSVSNRAVNGGVGEVILSAQEAYPGDTVTVTLEPGFESHLPENALVAYDGIELTKVDDTTWSFVMPWHAARLQASFEIDPAQGPGGVVTNAKELWQALGGRVDSEKGDIHVLDEENQTVTLTRCVELNDEIVVTDGPVMLMMDGMDITGAPKKRVLRIAASEDETTEGDLSISNSVTYLDSKLSSSEVTELILLQAGALTLTNRIQLEGIGSRVEKTCAVIRVEGGLLTLGAEGDDAEESIRNVQILGENCDDGIRITGGKVVMHSGRVAGGSYWNYKADAEDASLMGGDDSVPHDQPGGNGIHISDVGALEINNGRVEAGSNRAALLISGGADNVPATGKICMKYGELQSCYGSGLVTEVKATDLQITGGKIAYSWFYHGYTVDLKEDSVLADYVPVGIVIRNEREEIPGDESRYDDTLYFEEGEVNAPEIVPYNDALIVELEAVTQPMAVMAGIYNADHKLLDIRVIYVTRGETGVKFDGYVPGEDEVVKIFFMNEKGEAPLRQEIIYPVP